MSWWLLMELSVYVSTKVTLSKKYMDLWMWIVVKMKTVVWCGDM